MDGEDKENNSASENNVPEKGDIDVICKRKLGFSIKELLKRKATAYENCIRANLENAYAIRNKMCNDAQQKEVDRLSAICDDLNVKYQSLFV